MKTANLIGSARNYFTASNLTEKINSFAAFAF